MNQKARAKKTLANSEPRKEKVFVLDASAIYNGILAANLFGKKFIPNCVISEIAGMFRGEAVIEEASLNQDLTWVSPTNNSLEKVSGIAAKTGDIQELSECDLSVVAVAIDLMNQDYSVEILSDDYDIQNLASHLQIQCNGIAWKGISWIYHYFWECPVCKSKSKVQLDYCQECGTKMKKKIVRRKIDKKSQK